MVRKCTFALGEYYYLYNRGSDKRIIFTNDIDSWRFILLLYLSNSTKPFNVRELLNQNLPPRTGLGDE